VKWAKEAAAAVGRAGRRTGAESGVVVVVAVVKLLAVEDNQGAAVDQTGVAKRLIVVCIAGREDVSGAVESCVKKVDDENSPGNLHHIRKTHITNVGRSEKQLEFSCCIVDLKTMLERVLSPLVDAFVPHCCPSAYL
jgi:hypothetical protein